MTLQVIFCLVLITLAMVVLEKLILALFYIIYILAWRIYDGTEKANKVTSLIAILGAINVPIIKYSVDWWSTLHQPASISIFSKTSIHSSMMTPLALMTAAFAQDQKTRLIVNDAVYSGYLEAMNVNQRLFMLLPLIQIGRAHV